MKISSTVNLKASNSKFLFQYLAAISSTLSIICSGMHYGWPSPSLPKLLHTNSTIPMSNEEGSWMAVMPLIGAIAGSLTAAATIDIIGRKKLILFTSFPFLTGWIMVAYASSVTTLYIARLIAGFADGITYTAVPMYVGEIAAPKIRGFLGCSCSVTMILGFLLINIIGSYLSITKTALISSMVPILLLVTFLWMPESPYYLIMRGKDEEAKKSLKIFRGQDDVDSELNRLSNAVKTEIRDNGKVWDLFTIKTNRKAVLIMMGLRAVQQFSGTTAVTFYAKMIFEESNSSISSNTATLIYFGVQLIMTIISSSIVDKAGRRPLLIVATVGSAFALFTEGTYFYIHYNTSINTYSFNFVPVVALIVFVIIFSIGLQTVPILMLGELFSTSVKAAALCFADIYFCILATVVSKFFQTMKDSFGIFVPFYIFTGCCLIGLIFVILCVPETKGKTLEDIQRYFNGEKNNESDEEKL